MRAKDLLEKDVDEKHYLSEKGLKGFIVRNNQRKNNFKFKPVTPDKCDILHTLTTEMYRATNNWIDETEANIRQLGNISGSDCKNPSWGRIYDETGLCPTLTTMEGGRREPMFLVREATKKGYKEAYEGDSINLEFPNSETRRGRAGNEVLQTLTTQPHQGIVCSPPLRIRKLTPKECWRAMGFDDSDFEKASNVKVGNRTMSDHQLYRQAGNSIVVDVLYYIYQMIQKKYPEHFKENMNVISLFSGIGAFEKALERL